MLRTRCRRLLMLPALLIALPAPVAVARENLLTGAVALRQEYDSNINLSPTNPQESWYTILTPELLFSSRSRTGQIQANYQLGFKKNLTNGDMTLDHDFRLQGKTSFSSRWQAGLSEGFHLSDDPIYAATLLPGLGQELSNLHQRRRYWVNSSSLHTDYLFARNSTLTLGYDNQIYTNQTEKQGNYVRHHPYLALGYQLDHQWRTEWSYDYIRGEFDQASDVVSHEAGLRLIDQATRHDQLSLAYNYTETRYLGPLPGYRLHDLHAGWSRNLNQQTTLTGSAGCTLVSQEGRDNQYVFNYSAALSRRLPRGSLTFSGEGGTDQMQFDGERDGLAKYWQVQGGGQVQLTEHLSANFSASLRNNDFVDQPGADQEKIDQASYSFSYLFSRWYTLSLGYLYRKEDYRQTDSYHDHRVFLELKATASNGLLRW